MKKLLSLLSILTISGTAVPITIAASPYQKEEKLTRNKRDNFNKLEVWYEFLAHDTLKAKISHNSWQTISFLKDTQTYNEFVNSLYSLLSTFPRLDHSGADGTFGDSDLWTIVSIIANKFDDINNVFKNKNNNNLGLLIVTNRASYWKSNDNYYGAHVNS